MKKELLMLGLISLIVLSGCVNKEDFEKCKGWCIENYKNCGDKEINYGIRTYIIDMRCECWCDPSTVVKDMDDLTQEK